ncbi:MAG: GNAT family N-acetyltransferase [Polyangiaceae bacterium]
MLPESIQRARSSLKLDHLPVVVLETPRLIVRPFFFDVRDWLAYRKYIEDEEVTRHLASPRRSEEQVAAGFVSLVVSGRADPHRRVFAVERRSGNEPIGECALFAEPGDHSLGFLGFILRRDAWGAGYATEAASAMLKHGFETLGFSRIAAGATPENLRSQRVLQKLGLEPARTPIDVPGAPSGVEPRVFVIERTRWLELGSANG